MLRVTTAASAVVVVSAGATVVVSAGATVVVSAGATVVVSVGAAVVFVVPLTAAPSLPQPPSRMLTPKATRPAAFCRWFDRVVRPMLTAGLG
jgi:hypothetical protein